MRLAHLSLAVAASATSVLAAPQELVLDINQAPAPIASSDPGGFTTGGDVVYFRAQTDATGAELWALDALGASQVRDIVPGPTSSNPQAITDLGGGTILFTASTPGSGTELWRSDGSASGTTQVTEIRPGPLGIDAEWPGDGYDYDLDFEIVPIGGIAYFQASDGAHGVELWRSDGTAAGTSMVLDLAPGPFTAEIEQLTAVGSTLYFTAQLPSAPGEPWLYRTDGTAAGTSVLPPFGGADPTDLTAVGDELFFVAGTPTEGRELWVTDGTVSGTRLVNDFVPGPTSSGITVLGAAGGELYLQVADDASEGLWRTDGSAAGTQLVLGLPVEPGFQHLVDVKEAAGGVVFLYRSAPSDYQVWRTDGSPGSEALLVSGLGPHRLQAAGGLVYFPGPAPEANLWVSDGLTASEVANVNPGDSDLPDDFADTADLGGQLVLAATGEGTGSEPWTSDGTGMALVGDLNVEGTSAGSFPSDLVRVGEWVLFGALTDTNGYELWRSDGTAAGTELLFELLPGSQGILLRSIVGIDGKAYFETYASGVHAQWVSDGTPAGTRILLAGEAYHADWYGSTNGRVVFREESYPDDVYVTDGTATGTTILASWLKPGEGVEFLGEVWFAADSPLAGEELHRTDGTVAGTMVAVETTPGPDGAEPEDLAVTEGLLYFTVRDGPREVWVTDGTQAGTKQVSVLPSGSSVLSPLGHAGRYYFVHATDDLGHELWVADSNGAGVVELLPGPGDGIVLPSDDALRLVGDRILFWGDDGSAEGLYAFDIALGSIAPVDTGFLSVGSIPIEIPGGGDVGLFQAAVASGAEAWRTDGTPAGTQPLFDLYVGPGSSSPSDFVRLGDKLLFAADDPDVGRELFSLPFVETGDWAVDSFATGCAGSSSPAPVVGSSGKAVAGTVLTVMGAGAVPGSLGLLLFGVEGSPVAVGPDCELLTGSPYYLAAAVAADLEGDVALDLPVPTSPASFGLPVHLQWIFDDPGGAFGGVASASNGLEVLVGP